MQKTDYAALAARYDQGWYRLEIEAEPGLKSLAAGSRVLDLACGTGSWLGRQTQEYAGTGLAWVGVDASPSMLGRARVKGIDAEWHLADAHELPFFDANFDFVKCRFAFHHFDHPEKAADEAARVLRAGGTLSVENLAPEYQRASWVYTFFPDARAVDQERFLPVTDQVALWEQRGLTVRARVRTEVRRYSWAEVLHEVENRDMSQLTLITEEAYQRGREAVEWESLRSPGFLGDVALLNLEACKGAAT